MAILIEGQVVIFIVVVVAGVTRRRVEVKVRLDELGVAEGNKGCE